MIAVPSIIMKNEDISDFYAFENYATFDRVRKLRWNNNAILQAISYHRTVYGEKITYNNLMDGLVKGTIESVMAMLFGALCAADCRMALPTFNRIYRDDHLSEYINAVYDGVKEYLAEPEICDTGDDLDTEWPDTQSEVKKKANQRTEKIGAIGCGQQKVSSASLSKKSRKQPTAG